METSTTLYAKIDAPDVVVRKAKNAGGEAVTKVLRGQTYEVAAPADGGWVKRSALRKARGTYRVTGDPDREDKGKSG